MAMYDSCEVVRDGLLWFNQLEAEGFGAGNFFAKHRFLVRRR